MKNTWNIANKIPKILACLLLVTGSLKAQGSTKQVLTLQVMELNKISLLGATPLLVNKVDSRDFAQLSATRARTTLVWTSNGENKKITVASSRSLRAGIRVITEEMSPQVGVVSAEVQFSNNFNYDLIVGLNKSAGKCVIRLTSTSSAEQRVERDTNVITFTITSG